MPAAPNVTDIDNTQKLIHVIGTIAITAGNYAAGGLTLNLASDLIKASGVPIDFRVHSFATAAAPNTTKYIYDFVPGTTQANGKLQIWVQDAVATNPLAELAAGAIPAGVIADKITFEAIFRRI